MASNYRRIDPGGIAMSDGGKGSRRRPRYVANETFEMNWDCIFQRKKDDAREQREDADGVSDRRDDQRPAAQGGFVPTTRKPGN